MTQWHQLTNDDLLRQLGDEATRGLGAVKPQRRLLWLNRAVAWEIELLVVGIHILILQQPFGTFRLPMIDCANVLSGALTILPLLELATWMERRGWFGELT